MLAGLRFTKDKEKEGKVKKKKDSKKRKKAKKKKQSSSSDSATGSSKSEAATKSEAAAKAQCSKPDGAATSGKADNPERLDWMTSVARDEERDFFSSLGTAKRTDEKLKPDPDKFKVSEREYNPFLRGEESSLPAPESASKLPSSVCVGDGGSGWRRRAKARLRQAQPPSEETPQCSSTSTPRLRSRDRPTPSPHRGRPRSRSPQPAALSVRELATRVTDADEVMRRMQAKYGATAAVAKPAAVAVQAPQEPEEPEDANALGALAMEAMLKGDMVRYEELNKRLEAKQAQMAATPAAKQPAAPQPAAPQTAASQQAGGAQKVQVIEEVDAAGRSRALLESVQTTSVKTKGRHQKGLANVVPKGSKGFYEDDDVSLNDLIRKERIEGQQDYNANFVNHIMKKGSKFKMLDEDEDEAYALGWFEDAAKKQDLKRRGERERRRERDDKQRLQINLAQCTRCLQSAKFGRRDALVSTSRHAYVCVESFNRCILPGQVFISPLEHHAAVTDLDEEVYVEMRNYQKCLVRFFEAEEPPRGVIFVESAVHRVSRDKALLGAGPHAAIVAYPVELGLLQQARAYWRKAFDEAECEFTVQHRKVIETDARGGVRKAIPKGFTYVHADFSLGGGYAHIVEGTQEFSRDFAQHTIAGMCELTVLDRAYGDRDAHRAACQELCARFRDGGFDWSSALAEG